MPRKQKNMWSKKHGVHHGKVAKGSPKTKREVTGQQLGSSPRKQPGQIRAEDRRGQQGKQEIMCAHLEGWQIWWSM